MCIYEKRAYAYFRIDTWCAIMGVKKFSPRSYSVHLFKLENGNRKYIPRWGKPKENSLQDYSNFI